MKYTFDEDIIKKKELDTPSFLLMLLIKTGVDIKELINKNVEENKIVPDLFNGGYLITQTWNDKCDDILLSSDNTVPKEDRLDILAVKLMELFPKGKKEGTSLYWRGNKKDTKLKLKKFFKLYGNKYTDEQILNATKKYIEGFNGNYSTMRVLKYFIWKNIRKTDSEGVGYIEEVSDLASYIENEGEEDTLRNDWTSIIN